MEQVTLTLAQCGIMTSLLLETGNQSLTIENTNIENTIYVRISDKKFLIDKNGNKFDLS